MRMLKYRECNITPWHLKFYFSNFLLVRKILKLFNSNYEDIKIISVGNNLPLSKYTVWEFRCESQNLTKYFMTEWGAELFAERIAIYDNLEYTISKISLSLLFDTL